MARDKNLVPRGLHGDSNHYSVRNVASDDPFEELDHMSSKPYLALMSRLTVLAAWDAGLNHRGAPTSRYQAGFSLRF